MKKTLVITFTDGTQQEMDATKMETALPGIVGVPANHDVWLRAMQQVATGGVVADGANEKYVRLIPPSQIKSVELKFEGVIMKA